MTPCIFSRILRTDKYQANLVSPRIPLVTDVFVVNSEVRNENHFVLHIKKANSTEDLHIFFDSALFLPLNSKHYSSNNYKMNHRISYYFTEVLLNFFPGISRALLGFKNYFSNFGMWKCISHDTMESQQSEINEINHISKTWLNELLSNVKCSLQSTSETRDSDHQAECKRSIGYNSKVQCFIQSEESVMNSLDSVVVNNENSKVSSISKNRKKRMLKRRSKIAVKKDVKKQSVSSACGSIESDFAAVFEDVHTLNSSFSEATDSEDSEFCIVFENNMHSFDSSISESTDSEDSEFSVVFEDHMHDSSFSDSTDSDEFSELADSDEFSESADSDDFSDSADSDEFSNVSQDHMHALDSCFSDSTDSEDEFSVVFQDDVQALNSSCEATDSVDGFLEIKETESCLIKACEDDANIPLFLSSELLIVNKSEFGFNSEPLATESTKYFVVCESVSKSERDSDKCCLEDVSNIHKDFVKNTCNFNNCNMKMRYLQEVNRKWEKITNELDLKPRLPTQVTFAPESDLVSIFTIEAYNRRNEWEANKMRFKVLISEVEKTLSPYLSPLHREKICKKMSIYDS